MQTIKHACHHYVDINRYATGISVRLDEVQRDQYDRRTRIELQRIGQRIAALKYIPISNSIERTDNDNDTHMDETSGNQAALHSQIRTSNASFVFQPENAEQLLSEALADAANTAIDTNTTGHTDNAPDRTTSNTSDSALANASRGSDNAQSLDTLISQLTDIAGSTDSESSSGDNTGTAEASSTASEHAGANCSHAQMHYQGLMHVLYTRLQQLVEFHTEQHRVRLQQSIAAKEWYVCTRFGCSRGFLLACHAMPFLPWHWRCKGSDIGIDQATESTTRDSRRLKCHRKRQLDYQYATNPTWCRC
jgi:hypothetical protein